MEASAQVRFIQNGGREFLTDEPISLHTYEEEKIDIHHIFPQKWCKDNEIERKRMDCIVNKAAISSRTALFALGSAQHSGKFSFASRICSN